MTVKNLFTRQRAFHWSPGNHREFADDHFVIERIALAAKATAVGSGDHANVTG